jgi:hypothetical protein
MARSFDIRGIKAADVFAKLKGGSDGDSNG